MRNSFMIGIYQSVVAILICLVVALFQTCAVSAQLIGSDYLSPTEGGNCWVPCKDTPNGNVAVPGTECEIFYVCREGKVINRLACSGGRAFDSKIQACNHKNEVICVDATCSPTLNPSEQPTYTPTYSPTVSPTVSPTKSPTVSPTGKKMHCDIILFFLCVIIDFALTSVSALLYRRSITNYITHRVAYSITDYITHSVTFSKKRQMEQHVLKSYTADGTAYPSIRYTFDGFLRSLQIMGNDGFGADFKFFYFDADREKFRYGLVNVAAFLANCMVEAIYDDTCDELNWQQVAGRYALSNSCGQEGRSYEDETCGIYSCIVDPNMEVTAITTANRVRAPPPMECRPGSGPGFYSGYWDTGTGTEVKNTPYSNTAGRIDVEGCCYWGRGALLTRGSCNIGKLNYYLGARAAREGRQSLFPNTDFCVDPEATCASSVAEELRWSTAFFEWAERVQRYNNDGWSYEQELMDFFDGGMNDDSFIDSASRIFSRGCHSAGCSELEVRKADSRKSNFYVIINEVFGIDSIKLSTKPPSQRPTPAPTLRPTVLTTPRPTRQPLNPTRRPTPYPLNPAPQPLGVTGQIDLSPQNPSLPPPTFPPSVKSVSFPTIQYPTTTTPRPIGQPSDSDADEQREKSDEPTYSETIISLEDSGAEKRSAQFKSSNTVMISCVGALLLLAMAWFD
ncbi:hypothetical protein ACHAXR_010960 [Thalassiosira sp. AJA248-18]